MLKDIVSIDAGLFRSMLYQKGTLSVQELGEITEYCESYIHLVLGWLLKDNQIFFEEKGDNLYIDLKK